MFTSFCTCCSLTCHCWRQITSYKCIDPIKKKITDKSINKCDTKSKIPYCRQDPFTCEDCDRYASIWLLYRGSSSDHKPIWLCSDDEQAWFYRPERPSDSKKCGLKMKAVRVWFTQYGMQESLVHWVPHLTKAFLGWYVFASISIFHYQCHWSFQN